MDTPDTEWEKVAVKLWNIALDNDNRNARQEFRDVLAQARTSRDTYWKERVRKEVEEILYENLMKEDLSLETIKPEMKTWRLANEHTIDSVRQALDTLLDNLK